MARRDPAERLAERLRTLRAARRRHKAELEGGGSRRAALSATQRAKVLQTTGGRCHICGGGIRGPWQADHVFPHSVGGAHSADNYLPAHALCNNYRWDYSAAEYQLILKLGVWIRKHIENETGLGRDAAAAFAAHEARRQGRRRTNETPASRGRAMR